MTSAEFSPVYTIGHSTRSIAKFVELLRQGQVDLDVDIRCRPRSRTNPQFNLDALPEALSAWQKPLDDLLRRFDGPDGRSGSQAPQGSDRRIHG